MIKHSQKKSCRIQQEAPMNTSGGITLYLDEIQNPRKQQISSPNSWSRSASQGCPESRSVPQRYLCTSHELKYLPSFERCSCEQIVLPVIQIFFFLMQWLRANLGQYDRSPLKRVSCIYVVNKDRILKPKFPETEYFWISLKRSEFPPNDNMKLSYDMIY